MKITSQILSLPPYISTTWTNIASIHVAYYEGDPMLIIEQVQGGQVEVPGLEPATIESIFAAHANALESSARPLQNAGTQNPSTLAFDLPVKIFGEGLETMGSMLQHNPEAADSPDLPKEVIDKIGTFIQVLGLSESTAFPTPEEGCNCTFCQIARTIHDSMRPKEEDQQAPNPEEPVSEEDLRFRNWDIEQKGSQLYLVKNPLDRNEHYNVYLGDPIGCTCGNRNCEHIRAVLST